MSTKHGDEEHLFGAVSYLCFFVTGGIFLLLEKDNVFIRFHAMQSLMFFGGVFAVLIILQLLPWGWLPGVFLNLAAFIAWIVLMWKAFQGEKIKIPFIGNLAEQQLAKM